MLIHSVESLAAVDGEGVRYALFLGGCPLNCIYCHNPDARFTGGCTQKSVDELFSKIKRYKPYFASGGGVTFSGGEPLLQAKEIVSLGNLLKTEGIGYTIDTSGGVDLDTDVKDALSGAGLVIVDLKFYDKADYKKYIGCDIKKVFDILDYLLSVNKRIWVRTVIVPGINDSEDYLDGYVNALLPYLKIIEKYELLAFHTMGFLKYEKLGLENPLKDTPALKKERLAVLQAYVDNKLKG